MVPVAAVLCSRAQKHPTFRNVQSARLTSCCARTPPMLEATGRRGAPAELGRALAAPRIWGRLEAWPHQVERRQP